MKTILLEEVKRINELMGLDSNIIVETNIFTELLKRDARQSLYSLGKVLKRQIKSVDDIVEADVTTILRSTSRAADEFKSMIVKAWGISADEFESKTTRELIQDLSTLGVKDGKDIIRIIKKASSDLGVEPKGGLPKPKGGGSVSPNIGARGNTGGASSNLDDVANDIFNDIELDLNRISKNQSSLSPEQQDFFEMISKLLKKHRLPKVSEKEIDDLIQNARALMNKAAGGQLQDAFNNLNSITRKLERMTTAEQKLFLKQLIRETNSNPTMQKMFKNYFVPWSDSRWSTDFMKTWKDSMTITKYMLFSSLAVDSVRGLYDLAKDREFKGHFGTEYPASVAIKTAAAAIPYVNILTSAAFFLESVIRTVKGDKPKPPVGGGESEGSVPDSMTSQTLNLSQSDAKKFVEDKNGLQSVLPQPLENYSSIEYKPLLGQDRKTKIQVWLDGTNTVTLEKIKTLRHPIDGEIKIVSN